MDNLKDGLLLIEAARQGDLEMVSHRLSPSEHTLIKSGTIFIWNEKEVNIKRWTDGRHWSNSRLKGRFLLYKESKSMNPMRKKTLCARTRDGEKFHVICYYYDTDITTLKKPSLSLNDYTIPPNFYFVGGENSPLLQYDPLRNDTITPTIHVDFKDLIKHGKHSPKLEKPSCDAASDADYKLDSKRHRKSSLEVSSSVEGSSSSITSRILFGPTSKLPPLNSLKFTHEKRFRIDEEYIKLLQSAIF